MIIDFDRNPALSIDQKLQSLMESVQLALSSLETEQAQKNRAYTNELSEIKKTMPGQYEYKTLVNAQSFATTTANAWQYTGCSLTVPAHHVYIVRLYTQYNAGKPVGLGIHSASTMSGAITAPLYNTENADGVQGYTMLLIPGTYYIWSKRAGTGTNTYTATAIDFDLS